VIPLSETVLQEHLQQLITVKITRRVYSQKNIFKPRRKHWNGEWSKFDW